MRYIFALLMFSSFAVEAKPHSDYSKYKHAPQKEFVHHQKKKSYQHKSHDQHRSKYNHHKYSWKKY
jgi:hypothetical protein